jgi:hypothetical protein
MYRSDPTKALRSVRLFPRLATANSTGSTFQRRKRVARLRTNAATDVDPITAAREQVRARLLQMILDNEQVRRNERRPSQT